MRAAICVLIAAVAAHAQARFPMTFAASVGDIDNPVVLEVATVYPEKSGVVRFEGRDRAGKPWRVWHSAAGGVGWTVVYTADFDADGQTDLLIAGHFPREGWCNDIPVTILMFDSAGRPSPWETRTMLPDDSAFPYVPLIVRDLDKDGRAEFIVTDCTGEKAYSVSGVYEARNGRISPLRRAVQPYVHIARRIHHNPAMTAAPSRLWQDPAEIAPNQPRRSITAIRTAEEGCGGMFVDVRDGKMAATERVECEPAKISTSDGATIPSWPAVVIDGAQGRDVYFERRWDGLMRLLREDHAVQQIGARSSLYASPTVDARPTNVIARLDATRLPSYDSRFLLLDDAGCRVMSHAAVMPCRMDERAAKLLDRLRSISLPSGLMRYGFDHRIEHLAGNRLTLLRADDLSEMGSIDFDPPSPAAALAGVAELSDGLLAQWKEGSRFRMTFHDADGKLLASGLTGSPEGTLLWADSAGIFFGTENPIRMARFKIAVEWTREQARPWRLP